jgi:hypothetical protein
VCSLVSVGSHLDGLDIVTRNSAPYMVAQVRCCCTTHDTRHTQYTIRHEAVRLSLCRRSQQARLEVADILRRALAREKSDELKVLRCPSLLV